MDEKEIKNRINEILKKEKEITPKERNVIGKNILDALGDERKMVLTYDSTKSEYKKGFNKPNVIDFLHKENAYGVESITDSVLFFKTTKINPYKNWIKLFVTYAKEHKMKFTLSLIAKGKSGDHKMIDSTKLKG